MSNGSIKAYTPKYKLIIPQFNIATWHDYIEEDFRLIDALFYNLFEIQNFAGQWKQLTKYLKDDVVFIGDDYKVDENGNLLHDTNGNLIPSEFSGRLVKVLVEHTTDNSVYFSQYYVRNKINYEFFADASAAQKWALEAKTAKEQTEEIAANIEEIEQNVITYKNTAQTAAQNALTSQNTAQTSATNAETYKNSAQSSAISAEQSKNEAKTQADLAKQYADQAASKEVNIDTDPTLSANSDNNVASQKATKSYVDNIVGNIETLLSEI